MRVDVRPLKDRPGHFAVVPHGSIDTLSHDDFRSAVEPVLSKRPKGIVIDLSEVDYISSAGLGVLFHLKKEQDKAGGKLLFCNAKPQIETLFRTVRFLPVDTVFRSLEEADAFFYKLMDDEIERRKGAGER